MNIFEYFPFKFYSYPPRGQEPAGASTFSPWPQPKEQQQQQRRGRQRPFQGPAGLRARLTRAHQVQGTSWAQSQAHSCTPGTVDQLGSEPGLPVHTRYRGPAGLRARLTRAHQVPGNSMVVTMSAAMLKKVFLCSFYRIFAY